MTPESLLHSLAEARSKVERVCGLLVSPSSEILDDCPTLLEQACRLLADTRSRLSAARGDPAVLGEARRLRFAVAHASKLLEAARDYHARWNQILGVMIGGYTPDGDPAPVVRRGRVSLTG